MAYGHPIHEYEQTIKLLQSELESTQSAMQTAEKKHKAMLASSEESLQALLNENAQGMSRTWRPREEKDGDAMMPPKKLPGMLPSSMPQPFMSQHTARPMAYANPPIAYARPIPNPAPQYRRSSYSMLHDSNLYLLQRQAMKADMTLQLAERQEREACRDRVSYLRHESEELRMQLHSAQDQAALAQFWGYVCLVLNTTHLPWILHLLSNLIGAVPEERPV